MRKKFAHKRNRLLIEAVSNHQRDTDEQSVVYSLNPDLLAP